LPQELLRTHCGRGERLEGDIALNDNVIPLRAGRPDEIENACTGRLPDELLAPTCAGSVDPRPDPDDLDHGPIGELD
jgi:hypothetical protein